MAKNLPSFAHELTADKHGFAFGGVDPGTLHAHGKLIKAHHVRRRATRTVHRSPSARFVRPVCAPCTTTEVVAHGIVLQVHYSVGLAGTRAQRLEPSTCRPASSSCGLLSLR